MTAPISQAEWERLRRESVEALPSMVASLGLPSVLLPYQQRTVRLLETSGVRVLFIEKSRRIGETWALASYAVLRAGRERTAGGMDAMYISYAQEMTREFIDACAMWARAYAMVALDTQEFLFEDANPADPSQTRSIQAFRIRFASGFEIIALSSAPRTLRGKQGLVIIDEAAFVDNLKELLKAAMAFLMWGGQVVVCSTHNGAENEFNIQVQEILGGRLPYRHLRIDFDQALRDGLYQRICLVTRQEWTPAAEAKWRADIIAFYADGADEELFCVPSQGSGAWLSAPLIESRMRDGVPFLALTLPPDYLQRPKHEQARLFDAFTAELKTVLDGLDLEPQYAFGFDFGRVADLSVATLLATLKNMKRREALTVEMRGVPGEEQKTVVRAILRKVRHRLQGAAFDAVGMGWTVAEDMGREFGLREGEDGSGLVAAVKFTEEWYRLHMPPLKVAFEDDAIEIGRNAEHLSDLRLVKVVRGTPRVPDARTGEAGKKRHGDFAIALALAHWASRMRWVEYGYTPVPSTGSGQASPSTGSGFMRPDHSGDGGGGSWLGRVGKRLIGGL